MLFLAALDLLGLFHQHALQAGPEKCCNANRFLSSGAIHDDGVQTAEALAFQQRYQRLRRRGQGRNSCWKRQMDTLLLTNVFAPDPFRDPWTQTGAGLEALQLIGQQCRLGR